MRYRFLFLLFGVLCTAAALAQDSVAVSAEIFPGITARYAVLTSDHKTMTGLYQAFAKKNIAVASGLYKQGKRVSVWHFFDKSGRLMQHFNYNTYRLLYEAPEDSASKFKYILDDKFTSKDTVSKPIRVGGRYFGYLPYLSLFRLPRGFISDDPDVRLPIVYMELLVSPGGRLADYRVHIVSAAYGERVLDINISNLSDEERLFVPASINGKAVSSRIIILCSLTGSRRLSIDAD